jgi:hypothetical protein
VVRFVGNSLSFDQLNVLRTDIHCILQNDVGEAARSTQPVTLYIAVEITNLYNNSQSIPTEDVDSPVEGGTILGRVQSPEYVIRLSHRRSVEASNTMPVRQEGVSPTSTKDLHFALRWADEVMKRVVLIGRSNTWEGAVGRIKWVMDTLGPIAEVRAMLF